MSAASLIHRLGYAIIVAPDVQVYHMPDVSRYTLQHVWNTIQAAKMTEYNQQADLYFPMNLAMWNLKRERREYWSKVFFEIGLPLYIRLENLMCFWAVGKMIQRLREALRERQKLYLGK